MIENTELILDSSVRLAATLLFAALGELVAERAGTINISLEGIMLSGAFAAAYASSETGSPTIGLVVGVLVGGVIGWIHANLSHRLAANQYVIGLVINLFALGAGDPDSPRRPSLEDIVHV